MIRELIHDPIFLSCKSKQYTKDDERIAVDLMDTLKAHKSTCVGMAANMIGELKRVIAFLNDDGKYMLMCNPVITKQEDEYFTEESCLSLLGGPRKCIRYRKIKVEYQTTDLKARIKTFTGFTAQIIQHEIDHCNGILI